MDSPPLKPIPTDSSKPVTEADLHAYADHLLDPTRHVEIDAFLDAHPAERERVVRLIGLLDGVSAAQGVRIFIGAETRLFSLSGSAVIAAPLTLDRSGVGVITGAVTCS